MRVRVRRGIRWSPCCIPLRYSAISPSILLWRSAFRSFWATCCRKNFNAPYIATTFQSFWRRWHITLSLFLRDYLYIYSLEEPGRDVSIVPQCLDNDVAGRALARCVVEFRDLGWRPRFRARH